MCTYMHVHEHGVHNEEMRVCMCTCISACMLLLVEVIKLIMTEYIHTQGLHEEAMTITDVVKAMRQIHVSTSCAYIHTHMNAYTGSS